jgi:hypothetical protein
MSKNRHALLLLILAGLIWAPPAAATNYVVNLTTDPDNTMGQCAAAGNCSLRQAVNTANANAGADVITFSVNTITLTNAPDAGGVAPSDSVTIDGGGTVTINVTGGARAFQWKQPGVSTITSALKNITVQGLTAGAAGGGGLVGGGLNPTPTNTVTMDHVTIRNNVLASGGGGALQVSGQGVTLNVVDSTISGNSVPAGGRGGGIFVGSFGKLNLTRSTVSGNSAPIGGGLDVEPGADTVNVVNSTFSGNSTTGLGAAIYDDNNAVNLSYNSFAGNTGPAGTGAVEINGGSGADIKGNIFTGNTPANCKSVSPPTTAGFNFDSGTTCVTGANPTDHASTTVTLGALADNGGPTFTRALPSGSPAIDAGGTGGACTAIGGGSLGTDQRGTARPQGAQCDSGAFEFVSPPANTALPAIAGTAGAGQTLTCSQGSWSGGLPQTYAFQWRRDGADIAGATSSTYAVLAADQGHSLVCRVTATNSAASAAADSAAVTVPADGGDGGGGGGGGDGGGGGGGTTDTTPPAGTLEGKSKQDVDKLALTVGSNEQSTASGQASVSTGGAKKKPIASKTATAEIAANGTAKLTFKFSKKNLKKIKKLIKRGKKPKAKITVTVTDTATNKATLSKTVKLKD